MSTSAAAKAIATVVAVAALVLPSAAGATPGSLRKVATSR